MKSFFRLYILPWLVWAFYSLWSWTWRWSIHEPDSLKQGLEQKRPMIFAHWHGHELAIIPTVSRYKLATMTSTSKDGQLVDFVIRKLGGATSRGSSTRGGIRALKGLIRLVQQGRPASMAVDGPKGPIYRVKPGVFELSRLAHAPIYPVGVSVDRYICFERSWNKAILPKPFARISIYFLEAWPVLDKQTDLKAPKLQDQLAEQLANACGQAAKQLDSN